MDIILLDGYLGGSHVQWAKSLKKYCTANIEIIGLTPIHWKWRMQGAAIHFAKELNNKTENIDLIICTDMVNVPLLKSMLIPALRDVPVILYMHENQITYPWSPNDPELQNKHDASYGFLNYSSALASDRVLFNSNYHLNSFLDGVESLLGKMPDYRHLETIIEIEKKSEVAYVGIEWNKLQDYESTPSFEKPVILWNHRWEYDKNPELFFNALFQLKKENIDFELIVIGKEYERQPEIFKTANEILKENIIQYGYVENIEDYYRLLWKANILPVSNEQDFFGISVVEAIACQSFPILPKKLSYVEHLDPTEYPNQFYLENNLFEALKNVIDNKLFLDNKKTAQEVSKYEWSHLSKKYDQTFKELIRAK